MPAPFCMSACSRMHELFSGSIQILWSSWSCEALFHSYDRAGGWNMTPYREERILCIWPGADYPCTVPILRTSIGTDRDDHSFLKDSPWGELGYVSSRFIIAVVENFLGCGRLINFTETDMDPSSLLPEDIANFFEHVVPHSGVIIYRSKLSIYL